MSPLMMETKLAQLLTADLRSVNNDRHISMRYSETPIRSDIKPMELLLQLFLVRKKWLMTFSN